MKRRDFLHTSVSMGLGAMLAQTISSSSIRASEHDSHKMNIVFINIEDCCIDAIGCYGNPLAQTPNIDSLASSGLRFEHAFCSFPVCNPSRSAYLTGTRPHNNGVTKNMVYLHETAPDFVTLPELMKEEGRYLANFGKLFHWTSPRLRTFDRIGYCKLPPEPGEKLDLPPQGDPKITNQYGDSGRTPEQHIEHHIFSDGASVIQEQAQLNKPFFLSLGTHLPHSPWLCPKDFLERFDPDTLPLPRPSREEHQDISPFEYRAGVNFDVFQNTQPTEYEVREARAAYFASVSYVDSRIGIVLDAIEPAGIADRTIVLFFADHSMHLGEHGIFGKATLYDQSIRVPLIVRVPGLTTGGSVCSEMVEFIDILPTLCELTGIAIPEQVDGTSFVPLLEKPEQPWKEAIYSMVAYDESEMCVGHCVRTHKHKYTEWNSNEDPWNWGTPNTIYRCLYDLEQDPLETTNHFSDSEYATEAAKLSWLLHSQPGVYST